MCLTVACRAQQTKSLPRIASLLDGIPSWEFMAARNFICQILLFNGCESRFFSHLYILQAILKAAFIFILGLALTKTLVCGLAPVGSTVPYSHSLSMVGTGGEIRKVSVRSHGLR